MTTSTESNILAQLNNEGHNIPENLVWRVGHDTQEVCRSLQEIIDRATTLLAEIEGPRALRTLQKIQQAAGDRSPIGSLWEKVVARAAAIVTTAFVAYECEKKD